MFFSQGHFNLHNVYLRSSEVSCLCNPFCRWIGISVDVGCVCACVRKSLYFHQFLFTLTIGKYTLYLLIVIIFLFPFRSIPLLFSPLLLCKSLLFLCNAHACIHIRYNRWIFFTDEFALHIIMEIQMVCFIIEQILKSLKNVMPQDFPVCVRIFDENISVYFSHNLRCVHTPNELWPV